MDTIGSYDTVKLETSACFAGSSAGGCAGQHLRFGKGTLKDSFGGGNELLVEVTNNSTRSMTCTLTATFKKGDTIIGTATGVVNELPSGGTKTATLMSMESVDGFDSSKIEPSACF